MNLSNTNQLSFTDNFKKFQNFDDFNNYGNGISLIKKFSDNVSLLKFFIREKDLNTSECKKQIYITAHYGKEADGGGVFIRGNHKLSEPVDLRSEDYIYDVIDNQIITNKGKKISGEELVNKIYRLHLKPTRRILGFFLRMKLFFWHIFLKKIMYFISKLFSLILYIISGDKYSYEPIMQIEIINGKTVSSSFDGLYDKNKMEEKVKENKKIDFFGHQVDYWPVVFYAFLHLSIYLYFEFINFKPIILKNIFINDFLVLLYVICSFWFIQVCVPLILKKIIKFMSKLSVFFEMKTVKI